MLFSFFDYFEALHFLNDQCFSVKFEIAALNWRAVSVERTFQCKQATETQAAAKPDIITKIISSLTTVEDQIRIISKRHLNNLHPFLPFWFKHQNLHDTCHLLFCHVSHTLSFSTLWIFTLIFQNYPIVFQIIPTQQECSKTPIFLIREVTV